MTVCSTCGGNAWVYDASSGDGYEFVRPCHDCAPDVYDRWRAGHLDPDHTCAECRAGKPAARKPPTTRILEPTPVENEPPPPPTAEQIEAF